jgi:hypothetical protein
MDEDIRLIPFFGLPKTEETKYLTAELVVFNPRFK